MLHLDDEPEEEVSCCFTLHTFFPCYFRNVTDIHLPNNKCRRYCAIIAFWFFGFFVFLMKTNIDYLDRVDLDLNEMTKFLMYSTLIFLYICYQILFTCLITPFILIALVYHPFIFKIYKFLEIK